MRIINIMLGEGMGGIERSSADYAGSLLKAGSDVLMITSPNAAINQLILSDDYALTHLKQLGSWDIMAAKRLAHIIDKYQADCIITHGNRALQLSVKAGVKGVKIIATSHNYNMQHLGTADSVFCITNHMLKFLRTQYPKFNESNSFHVPNMLPKLHKYTPKHWHNPVRIGAIGRMVEKKGFTVLLKAIARLRDSLPENAAPFELWLAGDGEERGKLEKLTRELGLENIVTFHGWVQDAHEFYSQIDIFCLPSLDEAFGIVLLEAMNAALPIIATNTIGPQEIIAHNETGLLVEVGDANAICAALMQLINERELAKMLGKNAYDEVSTNYQQSIISGNILQYLKQITQS